MRGATIRRIAAAAELLLAASAGAAETPPDDAEARRRYFAAQKLFDEARWAEAAVELRASYDLSGYPAILYRIGLCEEMLGQLPQAIATYRRYLERDPSASRRAAVEERIQILEKAQAMNVAPPPPPMPPPLVSPPSPGRERKIAGVSLVAIGLASLVAGLASTGVAVAAADDLRLLQQTRGDFGAGAQAEDKRGRDATSASIALYAIGGAAVVAGMVVYGLGARADRRFRFALAPTATGGQLACAGSF